MSEKVVVLGGGFLGLNTALELRDAGREVVLIDEDLVHEYTPGTIDLLRGRVDPGDLEFDVEEVLGDIELVEERVKDIRPGEDAVETGEGIYGYDQLVVALGGEPVSYGIEGMESVESIESARELSSRLESAGEVTVVGSGYTGIEVAGEIAEKGRSVQIVEMATRPMPRLTSEASEKVLEMLNRRDIEFRGGKRVEEFDGNRLLLESGQEIISDLFVWCGGVQASETVQESLGTGPEGIKVNNGLSAVGYDNIFAGGDCADTDFMKTAHNAVRQSKVISKNITGADETLHRFEEDGLPLVVSLGDSGFIVSGGKVLWTGFPSRRLKDLVRVFYGMRLRLKKFF